jgi:Txe/YoeB family toxin of Txe-Axe toxin-antitoxin module
VWGNPARAGGHWKGFFVHDNREAVTAYYFHLVIMAKRDPQKLKELLEPLKGKDLCCWCREGEPCHADLLLYFANTDDKPGNQTYDEIREWCADRKI